MSARPLTPRVGALLLALYPEAWRARYGEEMRALLEDDPPSPRGLLSLVHGALAAHLRPRAGARAQDSTRMRLSLCAVFCCWIALSVAGAAFAKETEEAPFAALASRHGVLAAAHDAILAGALLGAVAIALGGLPLLWGAMRELARRRDARLAGALALPLLALGLFAALVAVLVAIAPAHLETRAQAFRLALLLPLWTGGLACALACALAPRLVLRRVASSRRALRRASALSVVVLAAMLLVSAGLVVYDAALARLSPALAAQSGGPIWPTTAATLAAAAALALLSTLLAALASARARAGAGASGAAR
jgi:hypothetical protein